MDDQTPPRETLDALADLFLTDPPPNPRSTAGTRCPPPDPSALTPATKTPAAPERPVPQQPVTMGSPGRLKNKAPEHVALDQNVTPQAVKTANRTRPGGFHRSPHPHNGLRLVGESVEDLADPPMSSPRLEAVFLGNLPGFAQPWLTQYAQYLAQRHGPVVIMQIDAQRVDLHLVTEEPVQPPLQEENAPEADAPADLSLSQWLERTTASLTPQVQVWLIPMPASWTPSMRLLAQHADRWTLVCGADDAAVVGTYRLLKQLVEVDAEAHAEQAHPIGLMLMGSDEATSRAAAEKLDHTASQFLDTPIQWIGWQKRMQPVNLHRVGEYLCHDRDPTPQVESFLLSMSGLVHQDEEADTTGKPGFEDAAPGDPTEEPASFSELVSLAKESETELHLVGNTGAPWRDRESMEPESPPIERTATPMASGLRSPGEPPAPAQPSPQSEISNLNLADYISIEGTALPACCPHHPQVQLLVDSLGCLHLLHRYDATARGTPVSLEPSERRGLREALVVLLESQNWAVEHLKLLQMTCPSLRLDPTAKPTLHLFTNDARGAVALAGRIGEMVKLHLLQQVVVGDSKTWFCTPLN